MEGTIKRNVVMMLMIASAANYFGIFYKYPVPVEDVCFVRHDQNHFIGQYIL